MRKVFAIAARDYRAAVFSKAFIISLVALPIMWGGSAAAQIFLKDKVDIAEKRFAIVDATRQIGAAIVDAAQKRNDSEIFSGTNGDRKQVKPRYVVELVPPDAESETQLKLHLSDRVRNEELFGFVMISGNLLTTDTDSDEMIVAYYSNSPTYEDFTHWFQRVLNAQTQMLRCGQAGLDPNLVHQAIRTENVASFGLVSLDKDGSVTDAESFDRLINFLMPLGLMTLMWVAVLVGASPMLQSVLEEKVGRIAEVLLGSVTPFQLMMGKLLGTVGVSLTIVSVYMSAGYLALRHAGYGDFFPAHLLPWFIVFQALAVLMYGSIFGSIGAAVTDAQEAQSSMMPVMVVTMAPLFVFMNVVREPGSTMALAMSLFPPSTPMLMILRQAIPPGVAIWQPLLGVALVLATTATCVFAAGRIFRVGLLMQGKGADYRQMFRWVLRG